MKKHFISLFDSAHRWWTISLFAAAVLLIVIASLIGIADNLPGIILMYAGIIALFFAFLHPWKKTMNYVILAAVCIGIFFLGLLAITILDKLNQEASIKLDGIVEGYALLVCIPGILAGIIGAIICAVRKK
jgi:hypothetical protein